MTKQVLHVLFKIADGDYAIAASDVLHMESFTGATRVPGAPAHIAGVMQIRSRVVPVVDVRARFGLPAIPLSLDSRVVVVQSGSRSVGLLVDSAREVVRIAPDDVKPTPDVISSQSAGFVTSMVQAGPRLFMLIDFHKLIAEEEVAHGVNA